MFLEKLVSADFWLVVLVAYLATRLHFGRRQTTWFAVVNLTAIAVLFGPLAFAVAFSIALLVFAGLTLTLRLRRPDQPLSGFPWPILLLGIFLFLPYKAALDYGARFVERGALFYDGFHPLLVPLAVLAASYVALRTWVVTRAVLVDGAPLLNPIALSGYLTPFFMLGPGPINVYGEHLKMDQATLPGDESFSRVLACVETITTGLVFKFVFANALFTFRAGVRGNGALPLSTWLDNTYFLVYTYFDFAGYSLIALGIGRLVGVPTPCNFNKPFLAATVTEFWQRWHMSLGEFVRTQIFIPLQLGLVRRYGFNGADWLTLGSLCVAFGFVGLWHRLTIHFLIWGIALALVMSLEKKVVGVMAKRLRRSPHRRWLGRVGAVFGPIYVVAIISASFLLVGQQMMPR